MNFILHLNLYLFPMILLAIIFAAIRVNSIQTTENRLFCRLLSSTFLLLSADLFSWLAEQLVFLAVPSMIWLINYTYFTLSPLCVLCWLNYVIFHLYKKTIFSLSRLKRMAILLPLIVYYIMLISTIFTGWLFSVSDDAVYLRGPYYFMPYLLVNIYLCLCLIFILNAFFKESLSFRKKQLIYMALLIILPAVAGVLQLIFYNVWIFLPVTALAELLMFIQLQDLQITVDALTHLNNRGCFDTYLKNQLEQPETHIPFYLFMMDLDNFKEINDTWGHVAGDAALIEAAAILTAFFTREHAFLARYGGDEFCAVLRCKDDAEAAALCRRLNSAFEQSTCLRQYPYTLSMSIGFARIVHSTENIQPHLIRCADEMMYKNKRRRKNT